MPEEKIEKKHLTPIVNLGHTPHGLSVYKGRHEMKFKVPPFGVVLADKRLVGLLRPQRNRTGSEDRFHPWDYLRWWDLGQDIIDEKTLKTARDEDSLMRARKETSVDLDKWAKQFSMLDPRWDWCPAYVPNGVATVTRSQATNWMFNYNHRQRDLLKDYLELMLNEGGALGNLGKDGKPKPLVSEAQEVKDWGLKRIEALEAEVKRGQGLGKRKNSLIRTAASERAAGRF